MARTPVFPPGDWEYAALRLDALTQAHYRHPVTLADLARHCGLSEGYVSELFKKQTGRNVMAFLNQLRVEQAARLLKETSYGLEEIAERVGFSSYFYFCRVFKKVTNQAPATYRRRGRSEEPGRDFGGSAPQV